MADGGVRVAETDGFESFLCCLDAQDDLVVLHLGIDRQHRAIVDVEVQVAYFAAGVVVLVDEFFRVQAAVDLPQRLLGHAHDGGLADAL